MRLSFEGNDFVLSNIFINRPSADYVGLFGYVGTGGEIRNLGIEEGSVMGATNVGCLSGGASGSLINECYASCAATGLSPSAAVGGLLGNVTALVTSSYATGEVTVRESDSYAGGLIGKAQDRVYFLLCRR